MKEDFIEMFFQEIVGSKNEQKIMKLLSRGLTENEILDEIFKTKDGEQ